MFTFCWVTWAGRVRRSLKRAVLAMRVPHHGMPGVNTEHVERCGLSDNTVHH